MTATAHALADSQGANILPAVSAANTAAATSASFDLSTAGLEGVMALLINTGAITGTLDVKIQDSADNSVFADVTGLTASQISTANQSRIIVFDERSVRRYIKVVGVVATGPVLVSYSLVAFKKASG